MKSDSNKNLHTESSESALVVKCTDVKNQTCDNLDPSKSKKSFETEVKSVPNMLADTSEAFYRTRAVPSRKIQADNLSPKSAKTKILPLNLRENDEEFETHSNMTFTGSNL